MALKLDVAIHNLCSLVIGQAQIYPPKVYRGRAQTHQAGVAQLVEHQLPKLRVAGSSPVSRSL